MNNNCKINNENCYEINNGENVQDEIVYNQIIQTYNDEILQVNLVNGNIAQGPIMMGNNSSNKQEDSKTEINNGEMLQTYPRIENDDDQDEIVYGEILETYNKLMLEKNRFHISN